jgi:hypothetical protein
MTQAPALLILAGAVALVACASQGPKTPAPTTPSPPASHVEALTTDSAKVQDKFAVPYGYRRVVASDGQQRFCRTDFHTGSLAQKTTVRLTRHQLQALQDDSQTFIQNVQRAGGESTKTFMPGAAGTMMGH